MPAVPVFWIDAEDHDWDEVRGCSVLDPDFNARTREGAGRPRARARTGRPRRARQQRHPALDELKPTLPPTEFTPRSARQLGKAYAPGATMTHAFGAWIDALLGPLGLVVFDCADPAVKPLVAPLFANELATPAARRRWRRKPARRSRASAITPRSRPQQDSVALFHLNGGREPIKHAPGDASSATHRARRRT